MSIHQTMPKLLSKSDSTLPCLMTVGRDAVAIRVGTVFAGARFTADTAVIPPSEGYKPGCDYVVSVVDGAAAAFVADAIPAASTQIGGFHFASGGNAPRRAGGDDVPAINPCSLWDLNFRPACPDPRGMAFVEALTGPFWCDIYLTAADHKEGTSRFGVTIADGDNRPWNPDGAPFKRFDYATAVAVMKHHGKGLLSHLEFFSAAHGVTEKTATPREPSTTGLDAARTSQRGIMQAAGNMWVWGHDGDPDEPRASIFGGSWIRGGNAGSRYAYVDYWPEVSYEHLALGAAVTTCSLDRRRDSDAAERTMALTRAEDFPPEIDQLIQAFNHCADGHSAQHVLNASLHMLAAAIGLVGRSNGVSLTEVQSYTDHICDGLRSVVNENWNRQSQPSDAPVRFG